VALPWDIFYPRNGSGEGGLFVLFCVIVCPLPDIYSGRETWNEVIPILLRPLNYTSETHTVSQYGRIVTVENKLPKLTNQEREERSREIESSLFDIFVKYEVSFSRAAEV